MAKVAILLGALCATSEAADCSSFAASNCVMPRPVYKKDGTCEATGCTDADCCDYVWSDTCNAEELKCTGDATKFTEAQVKESMGFVLLTTESAAKLVAAGLRTKSFPPACVASTTTKCNFEDCCEQKVIEDEGTPTTTFTPWDSSESSSADNDSLESSYSDSSMKSNQIDSSGSVDSSGSTASGSSGSYMKNFIYGILALICLKMCLAAMTPFLCPNRLNKIKKAKKKQQPPPEPVEEEMLLPPLVPMAPEVQYPVTSVMVPATYAPTYAMPATTMAAPAYAQAAPAYVV